MVSPRPKLTVITAVYNGEEFIHETIQSVLTFAIDIDFEYIVVDDGSTDRTAEILNGFGKQIRVITQKNAGESASVTRAFFEAKGDFLLVVSADDPLLTSKLFEEVFHWFEDDKDLVAVYPDWQMIDTNGKVIQEVIVPDYSDELLIGSCRTLPGPGVIFRTTAALAIGGRNKKWTYVGDYDFWLRLSRVGEIRHRGEVLAQWRHHPSSTSVSKRGLQMARERIDVVEEFLQANVIDDSLRRKSLGHAYYTAARLTFFDRRIPGKAYLLKAFSLRKGWVEESELRVIAFIILTPISRVLVKPFRFLKLMRIRNL